MAKDTENMVVIGFVDLRKLEVGFCTFCGKLFDYRVCCSDLLL